MAATKSEVFTSQFLDNIETRLQAYAYAYVYAV